MIIKIWSDVMCPFCFIGKKNFEQALDKVSFKNDIEIEWKSFQLDPTLEETNEVISSKEYLLKKKGFSEEQYLQMQGRLNEMGKAVGIDFTKGNPIAANTLKAHKLLHLAKQYGKQNELKELLLKAHFEDGLNVADTKVLVDLGNQLGMNSTAIENALLDESVAYEVKQDILEAQNIGVSGVPFFVLDNKYAVSGAQPVEVFVDALTQAYNEIEASKAVEDNNSCSIDGCE